VKQLKMKQKILVILLCGMSVFTAQARGQQQSDTLVLTLPDALTIALSESPMVRIADREIQRVDYSRQSAWINLMPSLDATARYSHFLVEGQTVMMGMIMPIPTTFMAEANLTLSLPLFVPALWQSLSMTKLDMQLAVERAHASRITLQNEVTRAYYGVLLAQDSYRTLHESLELSKELYRQARQRFELGLGSEFDAISAEVQMKNLQPTIMEVRNGIQQAKMFLKVMIGLDIEQPLAIRGSLFDYKDVINSANSLRFFSVENNTDLRQLDIQRSQLEKALSIQRTQRLPTLVGFATYGYQGVGQREMELNLFPPPAPPLQTEARRDWFSQGLIAGVQLNIPLTGIFTNSAQERQTRMQIEQLSIQRENLENTLNVQVRTALNNMDTAAKQVEASKRNEELAQRGHQIALARYETGLGIMLEVQNATNQLTQAQLSLNQAIVSFLNAKADVERLLGESGF